MRIASKLLLVVFLGLLVTGCNLLKPHYRPPYIYILDDLQKKHIQEMKSRFGFRCSGSGGSLMVGVKDVTLLFQTFAPTTEEEARQAILYGMDHFLDLINSNEEIREYLLTYPFGYEQLSYMLFFEFHNEEGNPQKPSMVKVRGNELWFCEEISTSPKSEVYHKETIQEARAKLTGTVSE